ncbi:MAG TPA: diguanylate cyclase [Burkholderiaceae bacterium]|jgi:protein-histidine pros-kinase|nr:diguanylate cyclase [Burkholderiaceae bacterium]
MALRTRFNLILFACFGVGLLGSAAYYQHESARLATEALEFEARLHMQTAMAVRQFTIERVKPHFDAAGGDSFVKAEVPAFAARETLALLYKEYPGYRYREAALNPTNPANRPDAWERAQIERYRDGRQAGEQVSVDDTPHGRVMRVMRPVKISDPSCLRCHGDPLRAPAGMRQAYPGSGGFHWQLGETVGAQIVSVPFDVQTRRADAAFRNFLVALAGVFALLFVALNVLLSRMVLQPLSSANVALDKLADTDALTGVHNRRALDRRLAHALSVARSNSQPLSVIAFDLDHFKQINDRHGHDAGDQVLKRVTAVVRERLRQPDTLARVGGEEFVIVLPQAKSDAAQRVAEALRQQVRAAVSSPATPVSASFGVTQWDGREPPQALLARADQALYAAKRGGRDRVEVL